MDVGTVYHLYNTGGNQSAVNQCVSLSHLVLRWCVALDGEYIFAQLTDVKIILRRL